MSAPYFVTRGAVLRETVTRETDKILTLLTEERGKTPVIARGARRKNSPFAAAAQPLAYSEWTLYERGNWLFAKEGNTIELFPGLRNSLETLSLAFYFAELAEAVAVEDAPAAPLLRHLLNGLYALSNLRRPLPLVKAAFELKFLCIAGFAPLADACAYCGRPDPSEPMLDPVRGVLRCRNCAPVDVPIRSPRCGISSTGTKSGCIRSVCPPTPCAAFPTPRNASFSRRWNAVSARWNFTRAYSRPTPTETVIS